MTTVQELRSLVSHESRRLLDQVHELGERMEAAGESVASYQEAEELHKLAWALERDARAIVLLGLELGCVSARLAGLAYVVQGVPISEPASEGVE